MNGVLCFGEALIDFIPLNEDNITYHKAPGGAPANVSVGIAKLGGHATFLGKVGEDVLGRFLQETLTDYKVNTKSLMFSAEARTGLTFVTLEPSGERHFSFYIQPSADQLITKDEISAELFVNHNIFHFGSISQINEPSKSATMHAIKLAKDNNMTISYDPNYRESLWLHENDAREIILSTIPLVDVLKVSDEELTFLTGCKTIEEGIKRLPNIPLVLITMGSNGCMYSFKEQLGHISAIKAKVIDTTGAGDAFVSGILYSLYTSQQPLQQLAVEELEAMIRFASISGGLATMKKGAMSGLPTLEEIQSYQLDVD